jgi:hypothetical protein
MDNPDLMNVLDPIDKLVEHSGSLFFLYSLFAVDVVEQFTLLHVLHNQEQLLGSLYNFVKLHDIRVPDQF